MSNAMVGIYKITSPSGRVYVGQSIRIHGRISAYKNMWCSGQPALYASLKKYGWAAHKFEVIHELPKDISRDVIDRYEALYMQLYSEAGVYLMNLKEAGARGSHFEEAKRKISEKAKGRKHTPEHVAKRALHMFGKRYALGYRHTEETKRKISARSAGGNHPCAVKVKSTTTGKIYDCIRDAAIEYGINRNTLVNQLSGHRANKTDLIYA